jgi:2-amino-4-hydroxy-6-hydroxymethyldihydropteridine diphosphokinase
MVTAFIALGSNVGDRLSHLQTAIDRLATEVRLTGASDVYETVPMYVTDQPSFLNAAVRIETELSPQALLSLLKRIEREVGRQTRPRYGPREADLDLISYGNLEYVYKTTGQIVLHLPHPKTGERRFVLQPLHDIQPDLQLAGLGDLPCLLAQTADQIPDLQRRSDAVLSI